jgi:hypothetical protein
MHNLDTKPWSNDGKKVFHYGREIRGADAKTFEVLLGDYARDAKHVYIGSHTCNKIDRATFRVLNANYGVDAHSVWFRNGPIKHADVTTFRPLDSGFIHNGATFAAGAFLRDGYSTDGKSVWFGVFELKTADPQSFVSLGNGFGHDRERVYFERKMIPGAHRQTWRHWRGYLSVDKDHVYWTGHKVEGVHRPSITLLEAENCFMDRHRLYSANQEITPEQYFNQLKYLEQSCARERTTIADGSIFQRLLMEWPQSV